MKVSLITVVYNNVDTVAASIESVLAQDYQNIEYIVIDGQSSDGTQEVIQQYAEHIDVFVSEKDEGLYDALNKGIALSTGDIVGVLHADDLFNANESISAVVSAFEKEPIDCVYGDLVYVDQEDTNKVVRTWKAGKYCVKKFLKGWMPPHPTFYVKKECVEQLGLYDTEFSCSADYELMLRYLYRGGLTAGYVNQTLVRMRTGGISNRSLPNRWRANQEDNIALRKNKIPMYPVVRTLKPLRKISQFSVDCYTNWISYGAIFLPLLILTLGFDQSSALGNLLSSKAGLATLFSWGVVLGSVPCLIKIANVKQLTDSPIARSSHQMPTPTLGGVAIYAAVLLSITVWTKIQGTNQLQYVLGAMTLIFFTGLKDDMLVIAPRKKFAAQLFAAGIIVLGMDLSIDNFHGVLGIEGLATWFSTPFTLIVFVLIVNAYNLVDGIDGLASTLGIIAACFFGTWFAVAGNTNYAILAFSTAGALLAFIKYNFSVNQKIFLGDTGSLIIGMLCATMALQFIKLNDQAVGSSYHFNNAFFIAIAVMGVAILDILRVFFLRIYRGQSPFQADRNHVHHLLVDLNFSHKKATVLLGIGNALLILVAVNTFSYLLPAAALLLALLIFASYLLFCHQLRFSNPTNVTLLFVRYIRRQNGKRAVKLIPFATQRAA